MENLLVLKLTNNEEILGEVTLTGTGYSILNPIGITVMRGQDGKPNIGFAPWPVYADTEKKNRTIDIDRASVLYSYEPAKDFVDNYNQIFGAGIILPPTKQLITG
jgi:hypothetical protein